MVAGMKFEQFLSPLLSNWLGLALLMGFLVLFKVIGSASFKGWFGEWSVSRGLNQLDSQHYTQFHDLYLPRPGGQGTTQLDHVVVSPFGIFVIETKNYRGWIFGSEKQRQWTQQIYRTKHRFQNPLHQNHLHVKALVEFLGMPENNFHSFVFFIGGAEFKTPMPGNVLNQGLRPWIERHSAPLIGHEALLAANLRLEILCRSTDRKAAARKHIKALRARNA
jgi:restriction system protein